MTADNQMGPILRSWLKDTTVTPPDAHRSVSKVMDRLPEVSRQRRWWLPSLRRQTTPVSPAAIPETEYQPTPIPASNGHSPTVLGRTQSMFSPVKAITAGAVVFALGGAFLIAQPFQQQGSVPGAVTDEAPAAPVAVTATNAAGGCDVSTDETLPGGINRHRWTCAPSWTWSDERLNGTVTKSHVQDGYADESGLTFENSAISIENDDGGWRQRPLLQVSFPDAPAAGAEVWVFDGDGAYEGLTTVLLVEPDYTTAGFIIDGDMPPAPENASTR
jgi:hypothetical protein